MGYRRRTYMTVDFFWLTWHCLLSYFFSTFFSPPFLPQPSFTSSYPLLFHCATWLPMTSTQDIMSKNKVYKSFIGLGYYETLTPGVIQRNVCRTYSLWSLLRTIVISILSVLVLILIYPNTHTHDIVSFFIYRLIYWTVSFFAVLQAFKLAVTHSSFNN